MTVSRPAPTPIIAVVLWGLGIAMAYAQSPATVTNENGYAVTRSQKVASKLSRRMS